VALYVTDRAGIQPIGRRLSPAGSGLTYDELPYAALVCRLMVSMDYHLFADHEGMEG